MRHAHRRRYRQVALLAALCALGCLAARAASATVPPSPALDEPRWRPGHPPIADARSGAMDQTDTLRVFGLEPRRFPPLPLPRVAALRPTAADVAESGTAAVITRRLGAPPADALSADGAASRASTAAASPRSSAPDAVAAFGPLQTVRNVARPPWQMNARLFIGWPDGVMGSCSASLIGPHHAITAGHCVYSHEDGGWAAWLVVVPAYEEGRAPLGTARGAHAMSWEPWIQAGDFNHDMAVIALDQDIGLQAGWFGLSALSCGEVKGLPISNAGYPAEAPFDGERLIFRSGRGDTCHSATVVHLDGASWGGHSGSSTYLRYADRRYITGVLSYTTFDGSVTGVVLLPDWRYDQIEGFLED